MFPRGARSQQADPMLQSLEPVFSPNAIHQPATRNTIILALSIEHNRFTETIDRIGVATLDTADLVRSGIDAQGSREITLRNRTIVFGDVQPRDNDRLHGCLFSNPEIVKREHIGKLTNSIFSPYDSSNRPCDIILVGKNLIDTTVTLNAYAGFDVFQQSSLKGYIDIETLPTLSRHPDLKSFTLYHICQALQIEANGLGNSGNDAMYLLKTLILSFIYYKRQILNVKCGGGAHCRQGPEDFIWEHRLATLFLLAKRGKVNGRETVDIPEYKD